MIAIIIVLSILGKKTIHTPLYRMMKLTNEDSSLMYRNILLLLLFLMSFLVFKIIKTFSLFVLDWFSNKLEQPVYYIL